MIAAPEVRVDYQCGTDEDLLARFRAGDVQAFECLLDRYSRPVYNFALRFLADPSDAEDVAQQTFIQAFESLANARLETSARPWLFHVARNKCIDLIRRRRATPFSALGRIDEEPAELAAADSEPLPDLIYERAELQQLIQDAIQSLPVRTREVVLMRYLGELTFSEIGSSLGIPENTAKTMFQRAKLVLRGQLRRRM